MGKHREKSTAAPNRGSTFGMNFDRTNVGVDDMVLLRSVTESGVLENLKIRHATDVIYTFIGHVLVVVNPYKWMNIYDESAMKKYVHKSRIDVPPHVFAIAEAAYRTALGEEDNQCIIISGESGAGKTEASKQIQNYIARVSSSGEGVGKVKEIFLQSNPLLEAFGNAKTVRNNNSSRFGKYFELMFDHGGSPQGGLVTNYLLEKSRVVRPGKGERNFHIFYQLLAGSPEKVRSAFYLKDPQEFAILNCSGCYLVDEVDDRKEFEETMAAMQHVGIKKRQIELVLQTIAAILHLGNVEFKSKQVGNAEGSCVAKSESLQYFCELTGIQQNAFEHALSFRLLQTMAPGGAIETYEVPQNVTQAEAARDCIAKDLYDRLFNFLVGRINAALDIEKKAEKMHEMLHKDALRTIGILDIYGFEIFEKNGFEQFCINYVNEKLQQIFIELTLKSEQEEYEREGIAWKPIPFFNNKIVCDLIEAKKPSGIFLILDDTVKTMHSRQGSSVDGSFLEKVYSFHQSNPHFSKRGKFFEIKHYAGDVQYIVDGFGDANRDSLSRDLLLIIKGSDNKLLQYIYPEVVDMNDKRLPQTSGYKIRSQCTALVEALMECNPHYVRCIKSNDQKKANCLDDRRVIHQVKYLGIIENINVRRAGYAYRGDYGRFVDRFRLLSPETYPDFKGSDKKGAKAILRAVSSSLTQLISEVQLGKTMVFIQTPETYFELEKLRERKISSFASKIQKCWKKYIGKRHFLIVSAEMTKIYQQNNKERQRGSMFRPFDGDYLLDESIRQGVMNILEFYNEEERIIFTDHVEKIISATGPEVCHSSPRVFVLTNRNIYLMEKRYWTPNKDPKSSWIPPLVYLRRKIPLKDIEGLVMSTLADPYIVLRVFPQVKLDSPDKSNWMDNHQAPACLDTNKPFGLFNRRHHCRFTGKIYCKDVCKQTVVVPDRGYYTPVRVHDSVVGFGSTEMLEDQLIAAEKKTEIASLILDYVMREHRRQVSLEFVNAFKLRPATVRELATSPEQDISIEKDSDTPSIKILGSNSKICIRVPEGVPEKYIKQRRKREKERLKKIERKRKEEAENREQRKLLREKQREDERQRRLAEKRARKQQERDAKQSELSRKTTVKDPRDGARKFGESSTTATTTTTTYGSNVNSELAAILAKRRG